MIYNVNELRKNTVALITQIDAQIDVVEAEAKKAGVPVSTVVDSNGNWVLNPLLMAKAMAYNTLVMLQTNEMRPTGRSAPRR